MSAQQSIAESLAYSPETGELTWKVFKGGGAPAVGSRAGYLNRGGYWNVNVNRRHYQAHRIAWLLTYGHWPKQKIDHINGNKCDNRIANLRDVSQQENTHNVVAARSNNKAGLLGVSPRRGRFVAQICVAGKVHDLGAFDSKEAARAAYLRAKAIFHPSFLGATR